MRELSGRILSGRAAALVSRLFDLVDARSVLLTFPTIRLAIKWCYLTLDSRHQAI